MKRSLVILAAMAAFTTSGMAAVPVAAAAVDQPESAQRSMGMGLAGGALLGAIFGGPPGAIAGMALGGISTDRMLVTRRASALEEQTVMLENERRSLLSERASLRARNNELDRVLKHERELAGPRVDAALLADGLEFAVGFRTNSATPPVHTGEGLDALALLVNSVPSLDVRLDGYADPRGSEQLNQALSQARADAIRARLVDAGVDPARIHVRAHGADGGGPGGAADQADPDEWALQRKVTIRLEQREGKLASKP
jgi:outer membrane protein OmpA-like peptidoglycan-associated protein